MEPFLSMILLWPCNFNPRGWAFCQGQLLSIAQNTALFSLLGTIYGGNGQTTFALPDFRGRVPVGVGQAPGASMYDLGQVGGTESTTLTINQMPAHTHAVAVTLTVKASNAQATDSAPTATVNTPAAPYDTLNASAIAGYNNQAPNTALNIGGGAASGVTAVAGASQPVTIMQSYLAVNYIIALQGIFPSRD
ncbi:tail fiber protein [Flavitalea sp. BT771]|uniref:phage tail protein n=1 Tax=Flavitalea sp. BT771 TaxID=3063329 RepID=UPI0026E35A1B|nr:tail fiber protein [Flavitalea sp. BT771]MDO6434218.1 tail fiber protein [Flavitalea sp. BT771]MDV6223118.1 tail fiber protein [Flavitalea sp. BT771]